MSKLPPRISHLPQQNAQLGVKMMGNQHMIKIIIKYSTGYEKCQSPVQTQGGIKPVSVCSDVLLP